MLTSFGVGGIKMGESIQLVDSLEVVGGVPESDFKLVVQNRAGVTVPQVLVQLFAHKDVEGRSEREPEDRQMIGSAGIDKPGSRSFSE